jgi:enamine deaminase RidA (YjgF/YER057c/UK114 family)
MARSLKKGPFVEWKLLDKIDRINDSGTKKPIKTWSRRSTITPDFVGHTQVIDAASEVFVDVFGDAGRHARLAVGVSSLPANIALEIEVTVEVAR